MSVNTVVSCTAHQKSQHLFLARFEESDWRGICASARNTRAPQAGCTKQLTRQHPHFPWRPTAQLPSLSKELRCRFSCWKLTMQKLLCKPMPFIRFFINADAYMSCLEYLSKNILIKYLLWRNERLPQCIWRFSSACVLCIFMWNAASDFSCQSPMSSL